MFDDLLLQPLTRRQLIATAQQPPQALLLVGSTGSGKATVVQALIAAWQVGPGYVRTIAPEDGRAIPIESIRQLSAFISLKVPGQAAVQRVVAITEADKLTTEAQNALLKMLEEPPAGLVFVLTAPSTEAVLPTILSRCQPLMVLPPGRQAASQFFEALHHDHKVVTEAVNLSGGLPGLTAALLSDQDHPLSQAISQARGLLGSKQYARLLLVDRLSKDKPQLLNTITVMGIMSRAALSRSSDQTAAKRWLQIQQACYDAERRLGRNGQAKLVLDTLLLSF